MTATAIKERPILMCGPMVRATLVDIKTQTRRLVKPQPNWVWSKPPVGVEGGRWVSHGCVSDLRCPHGSAGDHLWVKETWQHEDGSCDDHKCGQPTHIFYKATESYPESMKWRSSIYMPRWASRITIEITSVRVQRVQEISEEDARAEGIREVTKDGVVKKYCVYDMGDRSSVPWAEMPRTAVEAYRALWETINGEGSWAKNPWVWILGFRRIT